ncbi:MAG: glycosyltransferase family 2 protein [Bernardetiaceae bacterium]|jgi:glycosyltransferase involved in cell wall biosynthesis|nr:glycosyltransferase family 2 protein [Bernardetiaceae bacterium]
MDFSVIVLTLNEELHLPRLLAQVAQLGVPVFVVDSGSTDQTLAIAQQFGATVYFHPFVDHPQQWHYALTHLPVITPWVICLDADQVLTSPLLAKLAHFSDATLPADLNAIYFNRHNYFKGRRLRFGGYKKKYLLKMFRFGLGQSDLSARLDHRFLVPGRSLCWPDGVLKEENLKENDIGFWIAKHNRYSDLLASEEVAWRQNLPTNLAAARPAARLFGNPDERVMFAKNLWRHLPLYVRPFLYFFFRFFCQLGFLDGKEGRLFHFLHAFWFRLLVDVKIGEQLRQAERTGK